MTKHHLTDSPSGRFTAFYMAGAENVTIYDRTAKMWQFVLDETGTLDQLDEIVNAGGARVIQADIVWLISTLQAVDDWLETCPHDLRKFGEVGVSY